MAYLFNFYVIFVLFAVSVAYPVDLSSSSTDGLVAQGGAWSAPLLAVALLLVLIIGLLGCSCCYPGKGFQEFRNSTNTLSATEFVNPLPAAPADARQSPSGVVSSAPAPSTELTLFPPPALRPASFSSPEQPVSVTDWFDEARKDFPRTQLQFLEEYGRGWFGKILTAEAHYIYPSQSRTKVIVKMLHEDATTTDQMFFLHEVKPHRDLQHSNVLSLIGTCLNHHPYLLIFEACPNGDVKTFLQQCGASAAALCEGGVPVRMARDVTAGLEYMHAHKFVHTDLAARNALVTRDLTVKIGDYGNSIQLHPSDYYIAGSVALPVRWCAPETLKCTEHTIETKEVTSAANVWSLAVTIWEILELGKLPYEELSDDEVIARVLVDKERTVVLPPPKPLCKHVTEIYHLLKLCWEPSLQRPTAAQIRLILDNLVSSDAITARHSDVTSAKPDVTAGRQGDEFETRWQTSKPNYIAKTDNAIGRGAKVADSAATMPVGAFTQDFGKDIVPDSPRLRLTRAEPAPAEPDVAPELDSWLAGVEADNEEEQKLVRDVSDAIRELDAALALEKTSSSEASTHASPEKEILKNTRPDINASKAPEAKPWDDSAKVEDSGMKRWSGDSFDKIFGSRGVEFKLGDVSMTHASLTSYVQDTEEPKSLLFPAESSLPGSLPSALFDVEDAAWAARIERCEFSEKVKEKSRSIADLMVLTHIDPSDDSDSDKERSLGYRLNRPSLTSFRGSESDVRNAVLQESFHEHLKRLSTEHKQTGHFDSFNLILPQSRPDNFLCKVASEKFLTSSPSTNPFYEGFEEPPSLEQNWTSDRKPSEQEKHEEIIFSTEKFEKNAGASVESGKINGATKDKESENIAAVVLENALKPPVPSEREKAESNEESPKKFDNGDADVTENAFKTPTEKFVSVVPNQETENSELANEESLPRISSNQSTGLVDSRSVIDERLADKLYIALSPSKKSDIMSKSFIVDKFTQETPPVMTNEEPLTYQIDGVTRSSSAVWLVEEVKAHNSERPCESLQKVQSMPEVLCVKSSLPSIVNSGSLHASKDVEDVENVPIVNEATTKSEGNVDCSFVVNKEVHEELVQESTQENESSQAEDPKWTSVSPIPSEKDFIMVTSDNQDSAIGSSDEGLEANPSEMNSPVDQSGCGLTKSGFLIGSFGETKRTACDKNALSNIIELNVVFKDEKSALEENLDGDKRRSESATSVMLGPFEEHTLEYFQSVSTCDVPEPQLHIINHDTNLVGENEREEDETRLRTPDDERSSDSGFRDKGSLSESVDEDPSHPKYMIDDIEAELEEAFVKGAFDTQTNPSDGINFEFEESKFYESANEEAELGEMGELDTDYFPRDGQEGWCVDPPEAPMRPPDDPFVEALRAQLANSLPMMCRSFEMDQEAEETNSELPTINIDYGCTAVLSPIKEDDTEWPHFDPMPANGESGGTSTEARSPSQRRSRSNPRSPLLNNIDTDVFVQYLDLMVEHEGQIEGDVVREIQGDVSPRELVLKKAVSGGQDGGFEAAVEQALLEQPDSLLLVEDLEDGSITHIVDRQLTDPPAPQMSVDAFGSGDVSASDEACTEVTSSPDFLSDVTPDPTPFQSPRNVARVTPVEDMQPDDDAKEIVDAVQHLTGRQDSEEVSQEAGDEMMTSFCGEDEEDYARDPDWESDSDSNSSSSSPGFVWKGSASLQAEQNLRTLVNDDDDDDSSDDSACSDSASVTDFVPSAWDSHATPNKSALKRKILAENVVAGEKRRVWFKKEKYHCVYEYPREPSDAEEDVATINYSSIFNYSQFSDWQHTDTDLFFGDDEFTVSSSQRPFMTGSQFWATPQSLPGADVRPQRESLTLDLPSPVNPTPASAKDRRLEIGNLLDTSRSGFEERTTFSPSITHIDREEALVIDLLDTPTSSTKESLSEDALDTLLKAKDPQVSTPDEIDSAVLGTPQSPKGSGILELSSDVKTPESPILKTEELLILHTSGDDYSHKVPSVKGPIESAPIGSLDIPTNPKITGKDETSLQVEEVISDTLPEIASKPEMSPQNPSTFEVETQNNQKLADTISQFKDAPNENTREDMISPLLKDFNPTIADSQINPLLDLAPGSPLEIQKLANVNSSSSIQGASQTGVKSLPTLNASQNVFYVSSSQPAEVLRNVSEATVVKKSNDITECTSSYSENSQIPILGASTVQNIAEILAPSVSEAQNHSKLADSVLGHPL